MKENEFKTEVSKMNLDELKERARSLAEELMKMRFRKSSGQLEQSHRLRQVRRNLARVNTIIVAKSKKSN